MPKKKTHDQYTQEVIELRGDIYDFLTEYVDAKTMIKIRHRVCDYVWETNPNNLRKKNQKGNVCCPNCNGGGKSIGTERFKEKVKEVVENEYLVLGEYINGSTPIKMKHNIKECGYEYEVRPSCFLGSRKNRCPKCSGHIKDSIEEIKRKIFGLIGNEYDVLSEQYDFNNKITLKHNDCNHVFKMSPNNFISRNQRCPKCAGNKKKTTEQFMKEVYLLVKDEYTILGEYINSHTKIKMKHEKCGHIWNIAPSHFLNGNRCPFCNESKGEKRIREFLINNSIYFISQMEFDGLLGLGGRNLSYDFYIPKYNLLIEYQGEQHERYVKGFHKNKNSFKKQQEHDTRKQQFAEDNEIRLLEIWYRDFDNIEWILERELI